METIALSGSDPDLEEAPKLTKKQRAAALRKEQAETKSTGKGSEAPSGPPADNQQVQPGKGGQGGGKGGMVAQHGNGGGKSACKFYGMKGGCKMERNCWSYHDFGKASSEQRCFNCGAVDHRAEACTRPKGKPGAKGEEHAPRGESAGSSNNAGTSNHGGKGGSGGNQKGNGGKGDGKTSQVRRQLKRQPPLVQPRMLPGLIREWLRLSLRRRS